MSSIYVVGYPKSGNTYTARLLGEVLQAPVMGELNAVPIATEGLYRQSDTVVKQLHLKPILSKEGDNFVVSAVIASIPNISDNKVIHVMRDPRDVAVSCMHYWNISSLAATIRFMDIAPDESPLSVHGPWQEYVGKWNVLKGVLHEFYQIRYEDLIFNTHKSLRKLIRSVYPGGNKFSSGWITECIHAQSFDVKKAEIALDGDERPYGKAIQLKNMRKGKPGDWINHFTKETAIAAEKAFQPTMGALGYGDEPAWKQLISG